MPFKLQQQRGRLLRGIGRAAALLIWAVALAPLFALLPASILDQGPSGMVRPTPFPIALLALDPYVWTCAWNSLAMAAMVTFASGLVGLALALGVVGNRSFAVRMLVVIGIGVLAVPPAFGALGLRVLADRIGIGSSWSASTIWFWVAVGQGVPLVAIASAGALNQVEPAWIEAARLVGARRVKAWRKLVWPTISPGFARSLGMVFTLTLIEPGVPIVLGLQRTLGFQIVESALDRDQIGRAAVLALAATVIAAMVRFLLGRWGGTEIPASEDRSESLASRHSWAGHLGLVLMLGIVALFAWLPVAGLAFRSLKVGPARLVFSHFASLSSDPLIARFAVNSALVGLVVLSIELVLARSLAALVSTRFRRLSRVADWPEQVPPLAVGVGALALPWLLTTMTDSLALMVGSQSLMVRELHFLIGLIDLDRTPYVLLVLAVTTLRSTLPARSAIERIRALRPVYVEAAVCLGLPERKALRSLTGRWAGVGHDAAILTFVLAATNLTPALILCPTADVRTIGPAVLDYAQEPGALGRAAALGCLVIALNLVAIGFGRNAKAIA